MDFKVVDESYRLVVSRGGNRAQPNPLYDTLEAGETVFVEGESKKFAGYYESARRRGFKMNLRQTIIDGAKGCVIWWVKAEETAKEAN